MYKYFKYFVIVLTRYKTPFPLMLLKLLKILWIKEKSLIVCNFLLCRIVFNSIEFIFRDIPHFCLYVAAIISYVSMDRLIFVCCHI